MPKLCKDTLLILLYTEGTSDCSSTQCPPGTECVSQEVQCIKAPCNPVSTCVNTTSEFHLLRDRLIYHYLIWFIVFLLVEILDNSATCMTTMCPPGSYCMLQQVQCIRAPCYPVPQCVQMGKPKNLFHDDKYGLSKITWVIILSLRRTTSTTSSPSDLCYSSLSARNNLWTASSPVFHHSMLSTTWVRTSSDIQFRYKKCPLWLKRRMVHKA